MMKKEARNEIRVAGVLITWLTWLTFSLFAVPGIAQRQPPGAQSVEARFRTIETIEALDDLTAADEMQNGEKVYVKGEGPFVWDRTSIATVDNIRVFTAGVIGGRFVREPVGEVLQYTTAARLALRFPAGKTYWVLDTDQTKLYAGQGNGSEADPYWIEAGPGSGGGGGDVDLSYTASPTQGIVFASGDDAIILAADETNAGLMLPGDKTQLTNNQSVLGVGAGATSLGIMPGDLLANNLTVYTAFATLEQAVEQHTTLSGMPATSVHLGTFTGSTIPDDRTIKQAFQDVEAAIEAIEVGTSPINNATDAGLERRSGSVDVPSGSTITLSDTSSYHLVTADAYDTIAGMDATWHKEIITVRVSSSSSLEGTGNIDLSGSKGWVVEPTSFTNVVLQYNHETSKWEELSRE